MTKTPWSLAAALLSEEWIVEVGAVYHDVVVDAALSSDAEYVAVGSLRDRDTRSKKRETQKVAPVVGERGDYLGWKACHFG